MSRIVVCPSEDWALRAATYIIEFLQKKLHAGPQDHVTVGLAGGSTPAAVYRHWNLQAPPNFAWSRVSLYLSDERMVPLDHRDSNFRLARECLPKAPHLYPVNTTHTSERAAEDYEELLRDTVRVESGSGIPSLDLLLLGVGTDGHTASLFPGSSVLEERQALVVPSTHPESGQERVTFTLPLIQAASRVVFLVSGEAKSTILARVLAEGGQSMFPASRAALGSRDVVWFVDEEARGAPGA